jgi:scyllo-inositol 2-dehydrogenase (NADP+)
MSNLIIGFGVQGKKRLNFLKNKKNTVIVDPFNKESNYKNIQHLKDIKKFKKAYICTPESIKYKTIQYLLKNKKHVLVEKPLTLSKIQNHQIEKLIKKKKSTLYVAYNHRFEPHIKSVKNILDKNEIGKIYSVNLYYGNGTARLWKNSWREKNKYSIIDDLGVHLLDTFLYWFDFLPKKYQSVIKQNNELKCYDYFIFKSEEKFKTLFTVSVLDWRNKFEASIIGSKGSLNINCLCKWGPSILTKRIRKFPSGRPKELVTILKKKDPTWKAEENFFNKISKKNLNNFYENELITKAVKAIK